MYPLIVIMLITNVYGQSTLGAALYMPDGGVAYAWNDNQVYNAMTFQNYLESPELGTCILYEDFSLSGDCASVELDPDMDTNIDGRISILIDYD